MRPAETIPFVYEYEHGPLFWLGIAYQYLLVTAMCRCHLGFVSPGRNIYRQQALLVLFGLLVRLSVTCSTSPVR